MDVIRVVAGAGHRSDHCPREVGLEGGDDFGVVQLLEAGRGDDADGVVVRGLRDNSEEAEELHRWQQERRTGGGRGGVDVRER